MIGFDLPRLPEPEPSSEVSTVLIGCVSAVSVFFMHSDKPLPFFICFLQNTLTASSRHSLPTLSPFLNFGHFFKSFLPTSLNAFFRAFPHFFVFLAVPALFEAFLDVLFALFPFAELLDGCFTAFLAFLVTFLILWAGLLELSIGIQRRNHFLHA